MSDLPPELRMHIMSHLPNRNVAKMAGMSRSFKESAGAVHRMQLDQKVTAFKRARSFLWEKVARSMFAKMRAHIGELKKHNWVLPYERHLVGQLRGTYSKKPLAPGLVLQTGLGRVPGNNKFYMIFELATALSAANDEFRTPHAGVKLFFEEDELKARMMNGEEGPGFPYARKAAKWAVWWYSQHPMHRRNPTQYDPKALVPGKGAPFDVLRPQRANTRTLHQRILNSAQHPAVR